MDMMASDGKKICDVKTFWGEKLTDFHHRMLALYDSEIETLDDFAWFSKRKKRNGQQEKFHFKPIKSSASFAVVFFWYVNDFDDLDECVSWRINPNAFAIRKSAWDALAGFDSEIENPTLQALDFGYNFLKMYNTI